MSAFSHFAIIAFIPMLIGVSLYRFIKSRYLAKGVCIGLSGVTIIILMLDLMIFKQFRYHLSPIVLKMVFGKRASDIFQFSGADKVAPIVFILGVFLLQFVFIYFSKKIANRPNLFIRPTMFAFVISLLFSHLFYAWADANYYQPVTQLKNVFPAYYPLTADKALTALHLVDEKRAAQNQKMRISNTSNTVNYPLKELKHGNSTNKKNILFLVIDSWRNDYMTPAITPNIYSLSQKSQVFANHMSGSNMTTGGIFTLLYGIPATYYDTFTTQEISPVMMDELQKQQYAMRIFGSATIENPPFNRNVFAGIPNLKLFSKGATPADRDVEITNDWMASVDKSSDKPFFGFLFYDAAHAFDYPKDYPLPFMPSLPEVSYLDLTEDYEPSQLINRYKNSLHFIDGEIGKIYRQLEEKGLLQSTIIVITSDHGQEFNDLKKGYWQHGGNFSSFQIGVPLVIFDPGKRPAVHHHQTLHYDIAPTVMVNYLGVRNDMQEYSVGQNLYDNRKRHYFICGYNQRFAVIEKNRITNIYPGGLFDVTDGKLNMLDNDQINFALLTEGMTVLSRFYKKK